MSDDVDSDSSVPPQGMAARVAGFDWSRTPLGPRDGWSACLRALVDLMLASPQPAWIAFGPELVCLYNDAQVDVLGRKHPAALGRPLLETWSEMADVIEPVMRAILAGESQHFADRPFVLEGRPGSPTGWFSYSHVPFRNECGAVVGVWSVAIETTERVLAERARLEAESRFRTLFDEATPDGILIHERGRIVDANSRVCEVLGYTRDELLAMHVLDVQCDFDPAAANRVWDSLEPGRPRTIVGRLRRKNGTTFPVEVQVSLMRQGSHEYIVGIARDITERLQAAELSRRADDAEAAARIRSEFLANMSHEIRTPMSGVLGLAQLGHREAAHDPAAQARFAQILDCGKLLLTVINDILDFSKIEAGKLHLESVTFDPSRVVSSTLELFETAAARKGVALRSRIAPDVPRQCVGDPTRIQQVVLNLVSNGVKFTAAGAVTVTVARVGDRLEFAVEDTGIGIAADALARIFQPFEQGDGSVTRRYGGSGLGLAISQRLARLMDGSLGVDSTPGVGSAFRFTVPLREEEGARTDSTPTGAGEAQRLRGLRILAAEDDEFCALILRSVLDAEGATAHVVEDGRQALDAIERDPSAFDLVLTDVQMPGMDGVELTRRLREIAPSLPVIGQTAHALQDEIQRHLAAGMCATIQKPFDFDEFVTTVARHARRRD